MYFEQKVIDGILCHRSTPDGEWVKYSQEDLTGMLQNYHNIRVRLMDILDMASNYDYLKSRAQTLVTYIFTLPY